jgi:hypothetical protein
MEVYIINKTTGMTIKSFNSKEAAKEFASKCNNRNGVDSFSTFVYEAGVMNEI